MVDLLIELIAENRIVFAGLVTLLVWLICASLMGNIWPIVGGLLISLLVHWRLSKDLITLHLSGRNGSSPKEGVPSSVDVDQLPSNAHVQGTPED